MFKILVLAFLAALHVSATPVNFPASLEKLLRENGKADIFISLESPSQLLEQLKNQKFASRSDRKNVVGNTLKQYASQSQAALQKFLKEEGIPFKSFWISNEIYVKDASATLVDTVAQRSDVLKLRAENKQAKILPEVIQKFESKRSGKDLEWGLEMIMVQAVWDEGINGTGARVGILDTGVMWTHEALRDNYVGDYGWFDPNQGTPMPVDSGYHGTHVMGTIVGQGGIGVAPGAEWMACQNIPGAEAEDLACGEFMACPTLYDGSDPDCSQAPDIVSNSWGYSGGSPFFDVVFDAWDAAGIVSIFSAGNSGPGCTTGGYPGDSAHPKLITVGATDVNDELADFSSRGPSRFGVIKPNIAGPGVDVRSACTPGESSYCTLSGTSMSSPHVAGVAALIFSADPSATTDEVAEYIYVAARDSVAETGRDCGDIPESTYPNNHVGHGRLTAYSAFIPFNARK